MKKFTATIIDPVGMHARPAVVVVNAAKCFESKIIMKYNGKDADIKSIMNLISLGIPTHAEVEVDIEGVDEDLAADAMRKTLIHEGIIADDAKLVSAGLDNSVRKESL